jgi:hypothetical protein
VTYAIPADDRPRFIDWDAGLADQVPAEIRWWLPAIVHHGGRDATVVIDSKGEMTIMHGKDRVGAAAAPYSPHAPHGEDFWPLARFPQPDWHDPATLSHKLRDTGWMVAQVDDELGLALSVPSDGDAPMAWRLALAYTILGFYPPLGIEFRGDAAEFETGVDTIGERAARRVKRAMIERANHDRKTLRNLSDKIEANWRP